MKASGRQGQCQGERAVLGLILSLCACYVGAQDRDAIFRGAQKQAATGPEVATVIEPADGQYVYSSDPAVPRPRIRFAIGKAPQTDYAIFSAEEQHELDALRDRALVAHKPDGTSEAADPAIAHARVKSHTRRPATANLTRRTARTSTCEPSAKADRAAALSWPKVVQEGGKVCAPRVEFAEQPDWRDHLWCFNKGDGSVR